MMKILIIGTGGTIAGRMHQNDVDNYASGVFEVSEIIDSLHNTDNYANIDTMQLCNINSDDMSIDLMYELVLKIKETERNRSHDGIIITHGTDTLEETAFFLSLMDISIPVIITGAMLPADAEGADGPKNLIDSIKTLISLHNSKVSIKNNIFVQFSGKLYDGMNIIKCHTSKLDAFKESEKDIRDDIKRICDKEIRFDLIDKDSLHNIKVPVLYFSTEADPDIVDYYLSKNVKGFVIAGAGAGEYSLEFLDKTKLLNNKNIPVIRTSKIKNGSVNNNQELDSYVINGGYITPEKASIFLRIQLSLGNI